MDPNSLWEILLPRLQEYYRKTGDLAVIAEFVDAQPGTVQDWVSASQPPRGERLTRLWNFLEAAGFDSPELHDLPGFNAYLSALFSYRVINMAEAMEICGVTQSQAVLRAFRGQPPMRPALKLDGLQELYGERLEKEQEDLRQKLSSSTGPPVEEMGQPAPGRVANLSEGVAVATGGDNVMTLAMLLSAARPLARYVLSDSCIAADRSRLRSLIGEEILFELSNDVNALCSERARSQRR